MKKQLSKNKKETPMNNISQEYDFSKAKRVGTKYIKKLKAGTNIVILDPGLQKNFPTSESVNAALRLFLQIRQATL